MPLHTAKKRAANRRKAKRAGILAMYADQFAQSLVHIASDGKKKSKFDVKTIASRLRDAITGFETEADQEETETDGIGSDLVADIPLDDIESDEAIADGGASE